MHSTKPAAKRRKVEVLRPMTFLDLNDNCILKILNLLDFNSLKAISQSCTKLEKLAGKQFSLKYANESMTVFQGRLPSLIISTFPTYLQFFSKYVQKLSVESHNGAKASKLPLYLKANFGDSLKEISFKTGSYNGQLGNQISSILKNVENVTFPTNASAAFCKNILKRCKSLKRVRINQASIPPISLPNLEFFGIYLESHCWSFSQERVPLLNQFLELNQTIKYIHLEVRRTDAYTIIKFIRTIIDCAHNLETVHVAIANNIDIDAATISRALKPLDGRNNLRKLELSFSSLSFDSDGLQNPNAFAELNKLTGFYVTNFKKSRNLQSDWYVCQFEVFVHQLSPNR